MRAAQVVRRGAAVSRAAGWCIVAIMSIVRSVLVVSVLVLVAACGPGDEGSGGTDAASSSGSTGGGSSGGVTDGGTGGSSGGGTGGQSFPDPADAPTYDGDAFKAMQIYDVRNDVWLDELALLEALDPARLVFVGEQHETAPIHELQRWVLERELARHPEVALGMEHFQRDEQGVIDDYLAGTIDGATFEAQSQPWTGYATYWKQLVEVMRAAGRPVLALNVPEEALDSVYTQFPARPLEVVNAWTDAAPYAADVAPRPIGPWDATYQAYFEGSYDYETHGKDWGLTYQEALDYFTDLALLRDDTMGHWIAQHLEATEDRMVVVAGDWHVQTGLATPDSAAKFTGVEQRLITTATHASLEVVKAAGAAGRPVADFILVYDPA